MRNPKKIIYAASTMHESDFADLFSHSPGIPGQQAQRYNRLMIAGIAQNEVDVVVVSAPPVTRSNCSLRFVNRRKRKDGRVCWWYLPIINGGRIKNLFVLGMAFLRTFFVSLFCRTAIVCDVLNISVAMGAVSAGRLLGKRCVGIVTDIPELMVTGHSEKMVKYIRKIIEKCTDYVFLTEAMNERLNPKGKPYTIVEGICGCDTGASLSFEEKERSCLYAGLLDAEYGVKSMVDAFILADIPNCKMHLCGNGPYVEELKKVVSEHCNIEYHGTLFNAEVVALEKKVSLLINPRPSVGEFTKYSFPSKNMEYMTSGTPVLANKLPGVPDEYYDYMFAFFGESVGEMADTMKAVFSEPENVLEQKGKAAYQFVAECKNPFVQAKKVLELLK